jgi:hypothetical protein
MWMDLRWVLFWIAESGAARLIGEGGLPSWHGWRIWSPERWQGPLSANA